GRVARGRFPPGPRAGPGAREAWAKAGDPPNPAVARGPPRAPAPPPPADQDTADGAAVNPVAGVATHQDVAPGVVVAGQPVRGRAGADHVLDVAHAAGGRRTAE